MSKARIGSAFRKLTTGSAGTDSVAEKGLAAENAASAVEPGAVSGGASGSRSSGEAPSKASRKPKARPSSSRSQSSNSSKDRPSSARSQDKLPMVAKSVGVGAVAEPSSEAVGGAAKGTDTVTELPVVGSAGATPVISCPGKAKVDKTLPWSREERQAYIKKRAPASLDGATRHFLDDALENAPIPQPWVTTRDKSGRLYFMNSQTRDTTWSHPYEPMMLDLATIAQHTLHMDAEQRHSYIQNFHASWTQECQDELAKWFSTKDESGREYYYHSESEETIWENPIEGRVLPFYRAKLTSVAMLIDEDRVTTYLASNEHHAPLSAAPAMKEKSYDPPNGRSREPSKALGSVLEEEESASPAAPYFPQGVAAAIPSTVAVSGTTDGGYADDFLEEDDEEAQAPCDPGESRPEAVAAHTAVEAERVEDPTTSIGLQTAISELAQERIQHKKTVQQAAAEAQAVVSELEQERMHHQKSAQQVAEDAAEVCRTVAAQAAASALEQARSFHEEQRLHLQEEWEMERKALQADVSEAQRVAKAQYQEMAEEECRIQDSARSMQSDQAGLKSEMSEMRQLMAQQETYAQEHAAQLEKHAQEDSARRGLEEQLRQVLDEQRRRSETDRSVRLEWEEQQDQLKSEVSAAQEAQAAQHEKFKAETFAAKEAHQAEVTDVRKQVELSASHTLLPRPGDLQLDTGGTPPGSPMHAREGALGSQAPASHTVASAETLEEKRFQHDICQALEAQAAAEAAAQSAAHALEQERSQHELQSTRRDQEWEMERKALRADVLEAQEAAKTAAQLQIVAKASHEEALQHERKADLEGNAVQLDVIATRTSQDSVVGRLVATSSRSSSKDTPLQQSAALADNDALVLLSQENERMREDYVKLQREAAAAQATLIEQQNLQHEIQQAREAQATAEAAAHAAAQSTVIEQQNLQHEIQQAREAQATAEDAAHAAAQSTLIEQQNLQHEIQQAREAQATAEAAAHAVAQSTVIEQQSLQHEVQQAREAQIAAEAAAHAAVCALEQERLQRASGGHSQEMESEACPKIISPRLDSQHISHWDSEQLLQPEPESVCSLESPLQATAVVSNAKLQHVPTTLQYPSMEPDVLAQVRQQQIANVELQRLMQQQLREVADSCQQAVHLAESSATKAMSELSESITQLNESKDGSEQNTDWPTQQKAFMQDAIGQMEAHQEAMQQRLAMEVSEAMNVQATALQSVNELLVAQQDAGAHNGEVAQKRLADELRDSLEVQRVMFREAQSCTELAAQRQVQEAVESKAAARDEFEAEVRLALEDKQRQTLEANNALAVALQKQVLETFAPLAHHVEEVERRQEEDLSVSHAREEQARRELAAEVQRVKEVEKRARELQQRTEAAVQEQLGKAMELFRDQLRDAERARADDGERARRAEAERRAKMDEDREAQNRAERQAKWRLEEAEEKQIRSQESTFRLEEELQRARESEFKRKEEEARKQLELKADRQEIQWRAEKREIEWKAELRQVQWQMDWQKAKFTEESELLRPAELTRSRSSSRVRDQLLSAVASQFGVHIDAPAVVSAQSGRRASRPSSAGAVRSERSNGNWGDAAEAIERLVERVGVSSDAVPGGAGGPATHKQSARSKLQHDKTLADAAKKKSPQSIAANSRSSARPSSAGARSHRSLAEEVAADLDGVTFAEPSFSVAGSAGDASEAVSARKKAPSKRAQSSSNGMSYRDVASHSSKWFDMQRAKHRDRKTGGGPSAQAGSQTLDEVCRAYPELSQILLSTSH